MFWRDDYDKKIEECKMLHERLSDISDKFTQLKQTSTTEIKDLDSKLQEATQNEKVTSFEDDCLSKFKIENNKKATSRDLWIG